MSGKRSNVIYARMFFHLQSRHWESFLYKDLRRSGVITSSEPWLLCRERARFLAKICAIYYVVMLYFDYSLIEATFPLAAITR